MILPDNQTIHEVQTYLIKQSLSRFPFQDIAEIESDAGLAVLMAATHWNKEGIPDISYLKIYGMKRMMDLYRERWGRNRTLKDGLNQRKVKLDLHYALRIDSNPAHYERLPYKDLQDPHIEEFQSIIKEVYNQNKKYGLILHYTFEGYTLHEIQEVTGINYSTCSYLRIEAIKVAKSIHRMRQRELELV